MAWPPKIATVPPHLRPKKKWPIPTKPGFYWAKLVHPTRMPEGEDWAAVDWEPVEVFDNNGEGDEKFGVSCLGISPAQWPLDFIWGPKIEGFKNE